MTLIGATTENPSFALTPALISRCHVLVLERLSDEALLTLLERAEAALGHALPLDAAARARLAELADGDGRYLLNLVETLADLPPEPVLDPELPWRNTCSGACRSTTRARSRTTT